MNGHTHVPVSHENKRRWFAVILIALIVLAMEGLVRMAARVGWVQPKEFSAGNQVIRITFVGNLNPYFGVWHLPLASVRVSTPAGPIVYESNVYGMRDRPRELESSGRERVVVLGDSFVEGFGVAATNRFTDLLEARTGIEFMNFGTSGGFGSIQEWMLYEHLARHFSHTRVLLFLLPDNDFADNNPRLHAADRYQPFLQKSNGTYAVRYPFPFRPQLTKETRLTPGRALRHRWYNRWLTLNLLMTFDYERLWSPHMSSYSQYTDKDMARVRIPPITKSVFLPIDNNGWVDRLPMRIILRHSGQPRVSRSTRRRGEPSTGSRPPCRKTGPNVDW